MGARELKTRLGTYLRRVEHGETLVVTERGRPVAEIRPLPRRPADEREARLQELVRQGILSRAHAAPLAPFKPIRPKDGWSATKAVLDEREEGF